MTAWGYIPKNSKVKNFLLKLVGHPHPNGRIRAKAIKKYLEIKKTLDLGCGEGIFCIELARRGIDVTGIDISQEAINHAKINAKSLKLRIPFIVSGAEKLPFEDKSFDQVICLDVLEHVDDPIKVIKNIRKILREGGRLIITVPNELYLKKSILKFDFSVLLKKIGHTCPGYYLDELKQMLESNGFQVLHHTYYYKTFSQLITELVYKLMGTKKFDSTRKKMYAHSISSIMAFCFVYPFLHLDKLLPKNQKGGFTAICALKEN